MGRREWGFGSSAARYPRRSAGMTELARAGVAWLVLGGVGAAAGGVRRGLALLGAAFYLVGGWLAWSGLVSFGRSGVRGGLALMGVAAYLVGVVGVVRFGKFW